MKLIEGKEFVESLEIILDSNYIHMKSGNCYVPVGFCIEATNGDQDGMEKVIYHNILDPKKLYVRCKKQFLTNMVRKHDILYFENDIYKVDRIDATGDYRTEIWVRKDANITTNIHDELSSIFEHKYFMVYNYYTKNMRGQK